MPEKSARELWIRVLLFSLGGGGFINNNLFLLNFQPVARASPTAGVIPVLVLAVSSGWLTARFLRADGLSQAILGLTAPQRPFLHFGIGFIAGSALTGAWFVIVTLATNATWHLNAKFATVSLLSASLFALLNNVGEELIYRGYAFVRIAVHYGEFIPVVVTSTIFALLHFQAGLPLLSVLAGVFTAGLLFGATFARWRSLPLALGIHVATNIVQEATGLRPSAASIFSPDYSTVSVAANSTILASIAALNLIVAAGILLIGRQRRQDIWRPNKSLERTREG